LASVPLIVTLPGGVVIAAGLRIRQLRPYSAPDHTRIVLDLDAPARFETRVYTEPDRVVLEIPGAEAEDSVIDLADGIVQRIVVRGNLPGTVLLSVELVRASDYVAFPLAPNAGGEAHRIVLDIRKRLTAQEERAQQKEIDAVRQSGAVVIAIDAGHGGNDPGCSGHSLTEKSVALDVAKQMATAIGARARLKPILTRQKDYFVMLGQRQEIARKFEADIFVSIHCNSAPSVSARGAEVFFVSLQGAADKAAKELIDRENAADLVGGLPPDKIQGPINDILVNLKSNNAMRQSEQLGEIMLRHLGQLPGGETRGLKQGPLAVLKSITCPSVLVELGFVTNKQDARLLGDADTRRRYAELLAAGVDDYVRAAG